MDLAALRQNLDAVRARIDSACAAAGRDPAEVALVCVTKYAGPEFARALLELGQLDLGENRVDHLLELSDALAGDPRPRWHFIGHLQRNKAKKVAALLHALHSLESPKLLEKLTELRPPDRPPLEVYLELRLDEETGGRSGADEDQLPTLAAAVRAAERLRLAGVMGLPPFSADPEAARPHFQRLRRARDQLDPALGLSMGMTSDLEVAIAEGATAVRVGSALYAGTGLGPDAA